MSICYSAPLSTEGALLEETGREGSLVLEWCPDLNFGSWEHVSREKRNGWADDQRSEIGHRADMVKSGEGNHEEKNLFYCFCFLEGLYLVMLRLYSSLYTQDHF